MDKISSSDSPRTALGSLEGTLLAKQDAKVAANWPSRELVCVADMVHHGPKIMVLFVDTYRNPYY